MEMVRVLSEKLGIQVVLVSHNKESDVMEYSNKVFKVTKDDTGVSRITTMKG